MINDKRDTTTYSVTMSEPGQVYEFNVDIVNKGTIDGMVKLVTIDPIPDAYKNILDYSVTYVDGTPISPKDLYEAQTGKQTVKVYLKFKDDIQASDLPKDEVSLDLSVTVDFVQADDTANEVVIVEPVSKCVRATTLHQQECTRYDGCGSVSRGSTYNIGNLGTPGTLNTGDAFTCDINNDGVHDEATERFYYVSDLANDSNVAVLAYYTDITDAKYDGEDGWVNATRGPVELVKSIPTPEEWNGITLKYPVRTIKDDRGNVVKENFDYGNKAARMLSMDDIRDACELSGDGGYSGYDINFNKCNFLMDGADDEDTFYSPFENPFYEEYDSMDPENQYQWLIGFIQGDAKIEYYYGDAGGFRPDAPDGFRPVIELYKSELNY